MKRVKMTFGDILDFWPEIPFFAEARVYDNKRKVHGTVYKVDNMPKDKAEYILKWKNTMLVKTKAQYAPEIVHHAFIIYDKKIR